MMDQMTHARLQGLPDPEFQPEYYDDVPLKRLIAFVIDVFFVSLLTALTLPFTAFLGIFFFPALWFVVNLAYRIISISNSSATPGMRLAGIELRDGNGDPFTLGLAAVHTGIFVFGSSVFLLQAASVILMLSTKRARGLADHILGTAALNKFPTVARAL